MGHRVKFPTHFRSLIVHLLVAAKVIRRIQVVTSKGATNESTLSYVQNILYPVPCECLLSIYTRRGFFIPSGFEMEVSHSY